jgi:integrase
MQPAVSAVGFLGTTASDRTAFPLAMNQRERANVINSCCSSCPSKSRPTVMRRSRQRLLVDMNHGTDPRIAWLALALLMFTGQRRSDIIRFGRQHVRSGKLTFTQHKGRNRKPKKWPCRFCPHFSP